MLRSCITYITENTTSNRRNLIDCLGMYSTVNRTKQNVRREDLPTKEAKNVKTKLSGTYTAWKC